MSLGLKKDTVKLEAHQDAWDIEGAIACKYVHEIAQKKDLKLPLCDGLYKILNKETTIESYLYQLMHL